MDVGICIQVLMQTWADLYQFSHHTSSVCWVSQKQNSKSWGKLGIGREELQVTMFRNIPLINFPVLP